ncbi:MAG: radical SAM protein [Candidatus Verstraetearchaeota archaeon]|nr:radical SAM protein [Candidatus Verstraetearchaeota archaeon]
MNNCELVVWLITGKCNLKCLHCYASRFNGDNEISTDLALRIIKELTEINTQHISFTGGEPTIRKDLPLLISEARNFGYELSIVTNTFLLNYDLMKFLVKNDVEIQVSIDGVKKETFYKIRGMNLEILLEKLRQLKSLGAKIRPIMTLNKINYDEVADYVELAANYGAIEAAIIPVIPIGRANSELLPSYEITREAIISASQKADEIGFNIEIWCAPFALQFINSKRTKVCSCLIGRGLDIAPNGNIMLCDSIETKITNIKNNNIKEIWLTYLNYELVRKLTSVESLNEKCKKCKYVNKCLGGCHARAYAIFKNLLMPDPLCPLIH